MKNHGDSRVWLHLLIIVLLTISANSIHKKTDNLKEQFYTSNTKRNVPEDVTLFDKKPFKQNFYGQSFDNYRFKDNRPNILVIVTDDLDVELGSLNYMPNLMELMGKNGAIFSNSYTSTPMCCPSRSSMLTGMYIHNHEVYTNNQNCSSQRWRETHERRSFATYIKNSGYITAYYGKYLNKYNGSHVPAGWVEWGGLVGNSRYYNYSVNRNNRLYKYGNRYPQDYYPHVITADALKFLRKNYNAKHPFLLVASYPAPHGPEDSAPEHSHRFFNASDHHTAAYNYAPNPDKQWILQFTDRMTDMHMKFTDLLMTKRLQTLQSVDEAILKIVTELKILNKMDNTYIFFTSDHGYHLGQFGLAKGKSMPFEFDIKVPLLVSGPGIPSGSSFSQISLNIDLAPTLLDIAGVTIPKHMDGRSLLKVFQNNLKKNEWRDTFLVESSGRVREEEELQRKEQRLYEREKALSASLSEDSSFLFTSKHKKLQEVCAKEKFQWPCKNNQKWFCMKHGERWRLKKCRKKLSMWRQRCICQSKFGLGVFRKLDPQERRRQKKFLKRYVNKKKSVFNRKFIPSFNHVLIPSYNKKRNFKKVKKFMRRKTRSVSNDSEISEISSKSTITEYSPRNSDNETSLEIDKIEYEDLEDDIVHDFIEEEELKDLENQIIDISDEIHSLENATRPYEEINQDLNIKINTNCINNMDDCNPSMKSNGLWNNEKAALEEHMQRLREQLTVIKNIYKLLKEKRPVDELPETNPVVFEDFDIDLKRKDNKMKNFALIPYRFVVNNSVQMNIHDIYKNKQNNVGHLNSGNKGVKGKYDISFINLRAVPMEYLLKQEVTVNEISYPICWCDERVFRRLEIQRIRQERRRERKRLKEERKHKRFVRRNKKKDWCNVSHLHCFLHSNDHWRTPPLWTDGSFCLCISASNNTYWCLRTINEEQNFLYCEFITGLVTYYDLNIDPYELRNVAFTLSNEEVLRLHSKLTKLRTCSGAASCHKAEHIHHSNNLIIVTAKNETKITDNSMLENSHGNEVFSEKETRKKKKKSKKGKQLKKKKNDRLRKSDQLKKNRKKRHKRNKKRKNRKSKQLG